MDMYSGQQSSRVPIQQRCSPREKGMHIDSVNYGNI